MFPLPHLGPSWRGVSTAGPDLPGLNGWWLLNYQNPAAWARMEPLLEK